MKKQFDIKEFVGAIIAVQVVWAFQRKDPYSRAILGAMLGTLVMFYYPWVTFGAFIGSAIQVFDVVMGGKIVDNEYEGDIYYKEEDSSEARLLPRGKNIHMRTDGIVLASRPGQVLKIRNGVYLSVGRDGKVKYSTAFGRLANNAKGASWKSQKFIEQHPDWQLLFNKGKELWG